MADFDPLGLVKAMGPQTDPYSWAQQYAADAGKQDLVMKELRNKLLIAEMTKRMQSEEGAADRESRERIARENQAGAWGRLQHRLKFGAGGTLTKDYEHPPGTMTAREHSEGLALRRIKPGEYELRTIGGKDYYAPKGSSPSVFRGTSNKAPMRAPAKNAYEEDEED